MFIPSSTFIGFLGIFHPIRLFHPLLLLGSQEYIYALKLAARKNNLHKMTEKFISSERDTPTFTAYLICIIPFFTDERASKPGGGDFHS